jgi:pyridoxamine 5'-phosphate oxidase
VIEDLAPTAEPFLLFESWFKAAEVAEINDPNAMALATVGADGMPSVRMVLLKGHDPRGFCFFTNSQSQKGHELLAHPKAALCWHWKSLRRQIRAEGLIEQVSTAEADEYFASRPRGSQIGAWASLQSDPLPRRQDLIDSVKHYEKKYDGQSVPRPPHWLGFRVIPLAIEFWQDREFRLHDRVRFERPDQGVPWQGRRLYP